MSASCHLALALVIALLLVPAGATTKNLIELAATFVGDSEVAELEIIEISSPTTAELAAPDTRPGVRPSAPTLSR